MISLLTMLTCSLTIDRSPAIEQTVLIIDTNADSILYSGKTDSAGFFSWSIPSHINGHTVHVLAKFRTDQIVTTEYKMVTLSGNTEANFHVNTGELETLTIELKGVQGVPEQYYLSLEPFSVNGVPDSLSRFLTLEQNNVGGSYYYHLFRQSLISLKVQKGSYQIYARYFVVGRSTYEPKPASTNFNTIEVVCNGKSAPQVNGVGFAFTVDGPTSVVLKMRREE